MAGLEPAPQGLEGPQATVTPHSPWFGPWYQSLIPRPNADRWRSPAQELLSVVKDPCSFELVGGKGFEPNRSMGERVYGPSADHPLVPPSRRQDFSLAWPALSPPHVRPKQKRPSRGSPQKACFSMNAGPLGCFPLRIEHAAVGAIDPDRCHGSAHTGGDSRGAGQIEWPCQRRALRVEEHSSQRKPRAQCTSACFYCQQ